LCVCRETFSGAKADSVAKKDWPTEVAPKIVKSKIQKRVMNIEEVDAAKKVEPKVRKEDRIEKKKESPEKPKKKESPERLEEPKKTASPERLEEVPEEERLEESLQNGEEKDLNITNETFNGYFSINEVINEESRTDTFERSDEKEGDNHQVEDSEKKVW
jgi:hypothetical protein